MKNHNGNNKKKGKKGLIILLVILTGAGVVGFQEWKAAHQLSAEQRYKTLAVGRGPVAQTVSANGTLNPVALVQVGTQVSGTVKKLEADFNDRVKEGQILVVLDDSLLRAQVLQSEASVRNAQSALDLAAANDARNLELFRRGFISRQGLDQVVQANKSARAQLAMAQAQLRKDRTNLDYAVIRSPVAGVVVDRQVDVGQTVAASFQTPTLFRIAKDLRKMQIDSSFAEADIGNIRPGQLVVFKVDAYPNRLFKGVVRLTKLNPTNQQNVITYDVVITVDNPDEVLKPGMIAYVNIVVAQRKDALLVPNAALRFRPEPVSQTAVPPQGRGRVQAAQSAIYVLKHGQLRRVGIVPGITNNRFTEVLTGDLKPGDMVVVGDKQTNNQANQPGGTLRFRMY